MIRRFWPTLLSLLLLVGVVRPSFAQEETLKVTAQWDKTTRVSQTTASYQVVVNPHLRRGSAIHDNAFQSIRDTGANYVRYVPWYPYPKLAVPELVNKRNRTLEVTVPGASGGEQVYVDQTTALQPPASVKLKSDTVMLNGYSVAAVTLP